MNYLLLKYKPIVLNLLFLFTMKPVLVSSNFIQDNQDEAFAFERAVSRLCEMHEVRVERARARARPHHTLQ